jgi:hypothetical protein
MTGTRSTQWRQAVWRRPEWWALSLSAVAWVAMIAPAGADAHHHMEMEGRWSAWVGGFRHWSLMSIAMMLPLMVEAVRTVAARSLWSRRDRAICAFLCGYLGLWLLAGGVLTLAVVLANANREINPLVVAVVFALAAGWQFTPAKRVALSWCHRTQPLALRGWSADCDCFRYGFTLGVGCLASCGIAMIGCALANHSLLVVGCASSVVIVERYRARADQRLLAGLLAAVAVGFAVRALL